MTKNAEQLVTAALELPPQSRAFIAEKLIESLDLDPGTELSPEWKEEIRKRCQEVDKGTKELRKAEAVFLKAFDSLT